MKLKLNALASQPSSEEAELRDIVSHEAHLEAATRGKSMTALRPNASEGVGSAEEKPMVVTADKDPAVDVSAATDSSKSELPEDDDEAALKAQALSSTAANADTGLFDLLRALPQAPATAGVDEAETPPVAKAQGGKRAAKKVDPSEAQQAVETASTRQPPQAMVAGGVPAGAASVADVAGRMLAGAVASPFMALTSAHRHLTQRFGQQAAQQVSEPGLAASAKAGGLIAPAEMITQWKCEKIEQAATEVMRSASMLRDLEGFVVWEDSVLQEANKRGVLPHDVIAQMRDSADLAPLREQMNGLWRDNPGVVERYRRSADAFEKHIKDVNRKYANSDDSTKNRVLEAMQTVQDDVSDLPGFGREEGEYTLTLTERIRELARLLLQFVQSLMARLTGKAQSAEPTPSE